MRFNPIVRMRVNREVSMPNFFIKHLTSFKV
jgi:hypothetical protein